MAREGRRDDGQGGRERVMAKGGEERERNDTYMYKMAAAVQGMGMRGQGMGMRGQGMGMRGQGMGMRGQGMGMRGQGMG